MAEEINSANLELEKACQNIIIAYNNKKHSTIQFPLNVVFYANTETNIDLLNPVKENMKKARIQLKHSLEFEKENIILLRNH